MSQEPEFNFNQNVIFRTLRSKGFTSNCNFAFNSKLLVIGGKNANPLLYNMETGKMSEIGKKCSSQTDSITASAISQDGNYAATGYPDGTIILWNLLENSDGNAYKLIHKSMITNIAFIHDHKRLITVDFSGVITLLSLVQSLSCELVLQTTVINLKKPILTFVSLDPNYVAFASNDMFSFLSIERNIAVHISNGIECDSSEGEDSSAHYSCAITKNNNDKRALLCTNKKLVLSEVEEGKKANVILEKKDFESNIVQCFFIDYNKLLVVLEIGKAHILDIDGNIKNTIDDLPTDIIPSNIQKCGNSLLYFMDSAIFQKRIPLD